MPNIIVNKAVVVNQPELATLANNTNVVRFRLAENFNKKEPNGTFTKKGTLFYNVTVFDQYLQGKVLKLFQGALVSVTGKLEVNDYTDKNGIERQSHELVCQSLELIVKEALYNDYQRLEPTNTNNNYGNYQNSKTTQTGFPTNVQAAGFAPGTTAVNFPGSNATANTGNGGFPAAGGHRYPQAHQQQQIQQQQQPIPQPVQPIPQPMQQQMPQQTQQPMQMQMPQQTQMQMQQQQAQGQGQQVNQPPSSNNYSQ